MTQHHEAKFESQVIADMCEMGGWVKGKSSGYNKTLAVYTADLIDYIKATQADAYRKYQARYQNTADDEIVKLIANKTETQGTLHCLRNEIKAYPAHLKLCEFKPGLANSTREANYQRNICRIVPQLHYSENNNNAIDLVLFLNGIPIATMELKTDFTQTVEDAIQQYKLDRLPKDKRTRKAEPLLTFKRGALVHFALSTDEVYMSTHLNGLQTRFLPFNKGNNGSKGNPHNPDGFATDYLWKEVLTKDSFLNIIEKFIHLFIDDKTTNAKGIEKKQETLIFPRYHQLDVVKKLIEAVKLEHIGHKYLIQHSAGSGKSNSIAWLAHQLSALHDQKNNPYFDTIIVITDRTVLDSQLQKKIKQFEKTEGVVVAIECNSTFSSKSLYLATALKNGAKIIIVTIQTFPFVLEEIQKTTTLKDKRFAIIADEAHSSQTGQTAAKMKEVLKAEIIEGEISAEDALNAVIDNKADVSNMSFFAFTATPKQKTLELFGRRAKPDSPASQYNLPMAFHIYSMQQAIEEGFIIDVLKDYTTYKTVLKLLSKDGERQLEVKKAKLKLKQYGKLHPSAIGQKIDIILNHFAASIKPLLNQQAKAMVVTDSRKAAVKYKLEFDRFLEKEKHNPLFDRISAMVAFSGKVNDGAQEYTEANMNPKLTKVSAMAEAFDTDDYQVMLVADKFQTGFDQPKLCAMYIDKELSGVNAVQTLSRLNRPYPGKDHVFILDFVNDPQDIKAAFDPYYKTAEITDVTDPNLLYALYEKLNAYGIFTEAEIDHYAKAYYQNKNRQNLMSAAIKPAADRFKERYRHAVNREKQAQTELEQAMIRQDQIDITNAKSHLKEIKAEKEELEVFKKSLTTYVRMYDFLSQIHDYSDADLEKLASYARGLAPNLHITELTPEIDIGDIVLTNYRLISQGRQSIDLKGSHIKSIQPGQAQARDRKTDTLSNIVKQFNELFAGDFSDDDVVNFVTSVKDKVKEDPTTMEQIMANNKTRAMEGVLPKTVKRSVVKTLETHKDLCQQALSEAEKMTLITNLVADMIYAEKKTLRAKLDDRFASVF